MKAFSNILVFVDSTAKNDTIVERAAQLAEHHQARLTFVDVIPKLRWPAKLTVRDSRHLEQLLVQERHEQLQSIAGTLGQRELFITVKVLVGRSSEEIIREVQRHEHDLVMCHAKGARSQQQGALGTTSLRLLRQCPCPVWIVPNATGLPMQRILVAVDPRAYDDAHADLNATLMKLAKSLQEKGGGEVWVAHAWDLFGEQLMRSRLTPRQIEELKADERSEAEKALRQLINEHGLALNSDQVLLMEGDPGIAIPRLVERNKIDLLVMGTVARGGIARVMMGNTAETVLNRVHCSVLAVKPKDFVSAIRLEEEQHRAVTII